MDTYYHPFSVCALAFLKKKCWVEEEEEEEKRK
jgi:hypothetical protein